MSEIHKDLLKKQGLLIGAGVTLQLLGSVCFCAASFLAVQEIGTRLKRQLHELTRE